MDADALPAAHILPRKCILEVSSGVEVFTRSKAFADILRYIAACCESVEGVGRSQCVTPTVGQCCAPVRFILETLFPRLREIVDAVPLEDMKLQRFGNRAFREFHRRMVEELPDLMGQLVKALDEQEEKNPSRPCRRSEEDAAALSAELGEYIKDSFGNSTRIDYGTGHELHFFVLILICLQESGDTGELLSYSAENSTATLNALVTVLGGVGGKALEADSAAASDTSVDRKTVLYRRRQQFILQVFWEYIDFMRLLQKRYSLEPAGSHGVWGLDDYHHLPFVFGAAQLADMEQPPPQRRVPWGRTTAPQSSEPVPRAPDRSSAITTDSTDTTQAMAPPRGAGHDVILPKHVCESGALERLRHEYAYFAAIAWIRDNKKGPFFEHSNMLYNISGVERWAKILQGMLKMYAVEVLSKFNVVQHLLFGDHIVWVDAPGTGQRDPRQDCTEMPPTL